MKTYDFRWSLMLRTRHFEEKKSLKSEISTQKRTKKSDEIKNCFLSGNHVLFSELDSHS